VSSHSPDPHPVRPISDRAAPTADLAVPRGSVAGARSPGIEQLREIVEHSIGVVRTRRRLFRDVFLGVAVLLIGTILLQTPLYESTSLLLVKFEPGLRTWCDLRIVGWDGQHCHCDA